MNPEDPSSWLQAGNTWQIIGASLGSLLTGGVVGTLWFRRRLSSDAAEIANDKAEVDIIKTLQEDNQQLRASLKEVNAERDKLWKEMAEMSASMKIMEFQLSSIREELAALRAQKGTAQ